MGAKRSGRRDGFAQKRTVQDSSSWWALRSDAKCAWDSLTRVSGNPQGRAFVLRQLRDGLYASGGAFEYRLGDEDLYEEFDQEFG
jgi:hypothetical protein